MSFSISPSTAFSNINWDTFENRPPISDSMTFCEEENYYNDSKCCLDEYSIEHALKVAHKYGLQNEPEVKFLEKYPCLNGVELDSLADKIDELIPDADPTPPPVKPTQCLPIALYEQLKKFVCSE